MSEFAFYDWTQRKARKPHTCDECGWEIDAGDIYHEMRGVSDGSWHRNKTCAPCMGLLKDAWVDYPDGIELAEYVWGTHNYAEILTNEALLAFVRRKKDSKIRRTYQAALDGEDGLRRAWLGAIQVVDALTNLVDAATSKLESTEKQMHRAVTCPECKGEGGGWQRLGYLGEDREWCECPWCDDRGEMTVNEVIAAALREHVEAQQLKVDIKEMEQALVEEVSQ